MARIIRRALVCAGAALVSAGAALAAPVVVDTEQKAAAAVLSAHHFLFDRNDLNNSRQLVISITHPAREIVKIGLAMLAGATTPAALARSGGITLPCLHGGTLSAQLTLGLLRSVRLNFNACVLDQYDLHATYNGAGEVALLGEKFTATAAASLRLGTLTQDFTITTFQSFPPYSDVTDTRSFNLRMTGYIPLVQQFAGFYFTGPFAYEVTGFWDSFTTIVPPDPIYGLPSEHRHRVTAEHVITSGHLRMPVTSTTEWLDDETWLHSGRFTTYYDNINGWRNITESADFNGLRIRTKELYSAGRQTAVDGRVGLAWDPSRGAGCQSGDYTIKTKTPLLDDIFTGHYKAGEMLINGSTISSYSPPIVPDPSQPWLAQGPMSISVAGLGQFDYVFDWSVQYGLKPISQCSF